MRETEAYPLNTRASSSGQRYVEEPVWCLVVGSGGSVAGHRSYESARDTLQSFRG